MAVYDLFLEWGNEDLLPADGAQKVVDAIGDEMTNIHDDISGFPLLRNPYLISTEQITDFEGSYGLENGEDLGLTELERRKRLIAFSDTLRNKGTAPSLDYWFYYYGFRIEITTLWTTDYVTFDEYDPQTGDAAYYPTPHFILELDLGEEGYVVIDSEYSYSPTPIPNDAYDLVDVINHVNVIKPAETVLQYVNLNRVITDEYPFATEDLDLFKRISQFDEDVYPLPGDIFTYGQTSPYTPTYGGVDDAGDPLVYGGGYPDLLYVMITEFTDVEEAFDDMPTF